MRHRCPVALGVTTHAPLVSPPQVGVLKFGGPAGPVPLHPLATPFTDAHGPGIVGALRFGQDSTIGDAPVRALLGALDSRLKESV